MPARDVPHHPGPAPVRFREHEYEPFARVLQLPADGPDHGGEEGVVGDDSLRRVGDHDGKGVRTPGDEIACRSIGHVAQLLDGTHDDVPDLGGDRRLAVDDAGDARLGHARPRGDHFERGASHAGPSPEPPPKCLRGAGFLIGATSGSASRRWEQRIRRPERPEHGPGMSCPPPTPRPPTPHKIAERPFPEKLPRRQGAFFTR